ncbi:MAG: haloacid dehalogenase-like hydrolase [Anaerolineae bacterium]|nr:haloacid dehalogenase-like hydrolase [Anaerolineae bacterium]
MQLILFDIDGTLIALSRAGRTVLAGALRTVFGTAGPIDNYSMAGKTDALMIHDLMGAAGFAAATIETRLEEVFEEMAWQAPAVFARFEMRPCGGVPELLEALRRQNDVLLGLLTGNNRRIAGLKLQAAGLDPLLFPVGAFGCDHRDRNRLPGIALARAQALMGEAFVPEETVVVGDTPADIVCARSSGARAIAVATGGYSAATLATYDPDLLLYDLADTDSVLGSLRARAVDAHA